MFEKNKIVRKLVQFRYLGYMMVGGFILLFLFIANIGYITNFESVTALTISERVDTIAKALPSILGLVLLSIIAVFFIIFEMHLKFKFKGFSSPLHKLAHIEKSIVTQLSVDSDSLEEERIRKERKEGKFEITSIKPGEKIIGMAKHFAFAKEKQKASDVEEDLHEDREVKAVKKKIKRASFIKTSIENMKKKHDQRLKHKKIASKQRLLELQSKKRELLYKKKILARGHVYTIPQVTAKNVERERLIKSKLVEKAKKRGKKERLNRGRLLEKERLIQINQREKEQLRKANERSKLKQNRLLERERLKKQKEKEKFHQKRLLAKQEIRKEKEFVKRKKVLKKKRLYLKKEALKQERLLEKQKMKQARQREKKSRLAAKERLRVKKERERIKEKQELEKKRNLEQKKKERVSRLAAERKKRESERLRKKQMLEKRKQTSKHRRQKNKQERDSYYSDLQSNFNNLDKGLDSLMRRSRR